MLPEMRCWKGGGNGAGKCSYRHAEGQWQSSAKWNFTLYSMEITYGHGQERNRKQRGLNKQILWTLKMPLPMDWKQNFHLGTVFCMNFHFDLAVQSLTMHLQNINHLCSYFALLIFMYAPYKSCRNNDVSNSETTKKQKSLGSTNQAVTDTAQQSSMRVPHSVPGCRAQRAPLTRVRGSLTPSSWSAAYLHDYFSSEHKILEAQCNFKNTFSSTTFRLNGKSKGKVTEPNLKLGTCALWFWAFCNLSPG